MPRPVAQLAASDAHVPYGPPTERPSAQLMGDGALWVDPADNQALYQVQSGNWVRIGTGTAPVCAYEDVGSPLTLHEFLLLRSEAPEMRWAGDWDDTASYFPGDVVRAGLNTYVCVANSSGSAPALARSDTFVRADQTGWGTSADGHAWHALGTDYGLNNITSAHGLAPADVSDNVDITAFGAALSTSAVEITVRWSVDPSVSGDDGMDVDLNNDDAISTPVSVTVALSGHVKTVLTGTVVDLPGAWAGGTAGTDYRTRVRFAAGVLTVRTWPDGDAEPSGWDAAARTARSVPRGYVVLSNVGANASTTTKFDQLAVYTLTQPPGEQPDKWALMAGS